MNGDHDGDHEYGDKRNRPVQTAMLPFGSRPSKGEDLVEPFPLSTQVSQKGDVWNQSQVEGDGTDGEIGRDAANIPKERGSEMGIAKDIQHPVRSSEIDQNTTYPEQENENGGQLRASADGPPPFGFQDSQYG